MKDAGRSPAALARAEAEARRAASRDPTLVSAWRTIGLARAARRDLKPAVRMMRAAERVSRRDLGLNLWLIEERVAAGDVAGALKHYDAALRTSSRASDILIPILVSALGSDEIVEPLAAVLSEQPPWRRSLLTEINKTPSSINMARLVEMLVVRDPHADRDIVVDLVSQLIAKGEVERAGRIYGALTGRTGPLAPIRNPDFENANTVPPFDWRLTQTTQLVAETTSIEGAEGAVLSIRAEAGAGGVAAEQVLALRPGRYRLTSRIGVPADETPLRLFGRVTCNGKISSEQDLGAGPEAAMTFEIPANCRSQWLAIAVRSDFNASTASAWIDRLALKSA